MDDVQRRQVRDQLIVALDVETRQAALDLVETLGDRVSRYKIGARMFTRYGTEIVEAVGERGAEVFLDLKFHDIPNTVAGAVEAAADREDVFMVTVHASGGREMVRRAAEAAGREGPAIVAVTALTSLGERDVRDVAGGKELESWAHALGRLASEAGADGLVCSGHEVAAFRRAHGDALLLVTPGIRPEGAGADDQKRPVTPDEALEFGSDYLVVGRPIYRADDPVAVVEQIAAGIA